MNEANSVSGTAATAPQSLSAAVAHAEQCDAAGKHVDAVNHLAAGARRKDVEALTRLGKRLLVGDRAPLLANDGARLLTDAVELGGAEAAAVLAVLYAVGGRPQYGLGDALETLTLAAERGWAPAQKQLQLLAGHGEAEQRMRDWRRLCSGIDLAAWQTPPLGTALSGAPRIQLIPDFLGDAVCRWLVDRSRGRLRRALVYEALSKRTTVNDTRTNTAATFNLLDLDVVSVLAQVRMAACAGIPFRQLEPMSVLHYATGEEITEHYDFVDPAVPGYEQEIASKGQRVVTFLIYLNDDYAGGTTEFPEVGVSHKGRCGEALYFLNALPDGSADVRTLHAGRPATHGEKWIVSQFMRNRSTF